MIILLNRSFDLILSPKGELKATVMLQNNIIESYSLNPRAQIPQVLQVSKITIGGHRSDVRTLAFSSDNIAILSAAAESVKIWNRYEMSLTIGGETSCSKMFTGSIKHLNFRYTVYSDDYTFLFCH